MASEGVPIVLNAPGDSTEAVRHERDRFVALAFCAADLLIELDEDGRITFIAGAIQAMTGRTPGELRGTPLAACVWGEDRPQVERLVAATAPGSRLEPIEIRLAGKNGPTSPLTLYAYRLADMPNRVFVTLRFGVVSKGVSGRDPATGLYEQGAFAGLAAARAREAQERGQDVDLSLVRIQGVERLRQRIDDETHSRLLASVAEELRQIALGGEVAGRFDDENFGVLHSRGADVEGLTEQISRIVKDADPSGEGIQVVAGTVPADVAAMDEADAARAILYAMNKFCEAPAGAVAMAELSDGLAGIARGAAARVRMVRGLIEERAFSVVFQPIVNLATDDVSHFEALARFGGRADGPSPYDVITFAEATGLIIEFDLAMCERLLEWLRVSNGHGHRYTVAANVSGRSITNLSFVAALHTMLERYADVRTSLMFEVTESAHIHDLHGAGRVIQSLRKAGHRVCLDDFGAGAAAFHYLHALDVDVVKIDGQYLRAVETSPKARAFLKAMAGLCRDLKVETVAEMVENRSEVAILRECGVGYGQGYLFGKPQSDVAAFKPPRVRRLV